MATTTVRQSAGVITVHSPGLCAQLLDTGTKQHVELPTEKDVETEKVRKPTLACSLFHNFTATFTSLSCSQVTAVKNVRQRSSPYLDTAKIDRWLSAKAARGLQEFPPDLELASALQLCSNISREEQSFQRVWHVQMSVHS